MPSGPPLALAAEIGTIDHSIGLGKTAQRRLITGRPEERAERCTSRGEMGSISAPSSHGSSFVAEAEVGTPERITHPVTKSIPSESVAISTPIR
jgi:hypothetical protein